MLHFCQVGALHLRRAAECFIPSILQSEPGCQWHICQRVRFTAEKLALPKHSRSFCRLIEAPWWSPLLASRDGAWWLTSLDPAALSALPLRVRVGFLNAAEDMLRHLGHRLTPFLGLFAAVLVVLLEGACAPLAAPVGLPILRVLPLA